MITAKLDTSRLDGALQKRARGFKANFSEEMQDMGRMIAVSLATSAQPYGIGNDALKKGEIAVQRDIYKIYCTPSMVYGVISNYSKQYANTFYKALRATAYSTALSLIKAYAPKFSLVQIRPFDGGKLHQTRRNSRGRISKSQKPIVLVTDPKALQQYVAAEKAKVGFGKAGWANCARAFRAKGATRGLPSWVTRHKSAPASVAVSDADGKYLAVMVNEVPYAQDLLTPSAKASAVQIGVTRLVKSAVIAERRAASEAPL